MLYCSTVEVLLDVADLDHVSLGFGMPCRLLYFVCLHQLTLAGSKALLSQARNDAQEMDNWFYRPEEPVGSLHDSIKTSLRIVRHSRSRVANRQDEHRSRRRFHVLMSVCSLLNACGMKLF